MIINDNVNLQSDFSTVLNTNPWFNLDIQPVKIMKKQPIIATQ